ncbi:MAG: DUF1330 domain-containing protein [Casimicrobiaceae bacterium]|nr:DUF1330 domain-containing protein [Casimicrobiaceae bacterium]MCX8098258.1 DUF1330 domain-containing protein [Casimicrobiaceae bacterium]MDW8311258.1 DUF1330 domain-containing protein [Burkholderiales bacterium]
MTAYVIALVRVTDPERYQHYAALTPAAVAAAGGRFIVRGGDPEWLEGQLDRPRIVVIEFPDRAHARAFYASAAYQAAREKRLGAAEFSMVVVDAL